MNDHRSHAWKHFVAASLLGLMVTLNGCGGRPGRQVPPDRQCEHHLEWLGKAMSDYRTERGALPPAHIKVAGHRHSWRCLVAPYMAEYLDNPASIAYSFEIAWDSEYNRKAFQWSALETTLTCPVESNQVDYPYVSYVMLVRPGFDQSDEEFRAPMDVPDDAVLIVESTGCEIEYCEPRDIDFESLFEGDSPFGVGKLNSRHPFVVKALRVDGKVIDIPKSISKEKLRKLLMGTPAR